jgi:CheY-like chemotaxis protein
VALDSRAYSVMALVFHELATNAAKYGALSAQGGHLTVRWSIRADGACEVHWTEEGGPRVDTPTRSGFGTVLVDRSVPFDLGGESELAFLPTGVSARFLIPGKFVTDAAMPRREDGMVVTPQPQADGVINGLNVLVLEDQLVIAIDVEAMLAEYGAIAETSATAAEAFTSLSRHVPDAAVLDVHLGMDNSFTVADELTRREIPFVFATGFGEGLIIPDRLRGVPVVRKPYSARKLAESLGQAVAAAGAKKALGSRPA